MLKGLPEPYIKRTVEGDIGMRYSIRGIVDAAGIKTIAELARHERGACGGNHQYVCRKHRSFADGR